MTDFVDTELRKKLLKLRAELESVATTGDPSSQVVELDQTRLAITAAPIVSRSSSRSQRIFRDAISSK